MRKETLHDKTVMKNILTIQVTAFSRVGLLEHEQKHVRSPSRGHNFVFQTNGVGHTFESFYWQSKRQFHYPLAPKISRNIVLISR